MPREMQGGTVHPSLTPSQLRLFSPGRGHFHSLSMCWSSLTWSGFDSGFHHQYQWFSLFQFGSTWCACENLFMGNDELFRQSVQPWGLWRQQNATCHNLQSQGFSHRKSYTHFSWAREDTEHHRCSRAPEAEKRKATDWEPGQWPKGACVPPLDAGCWFSTSSRIQGFWTGGQACPLSM